MDFNYWGVVGVITARELKVQFFLLIVHFGITINRTDTVFRGSRGWGRQSFTFMKVLFFALQLTNLKKKNVLAMVLVLVSSFI